MRLAACIYIFYKTNTLFGAAVFRIIVIFNQIVLVDGTHITNDSTNIVTTGLNRPGKLVVADYADTIAPALRNIHALCAKDAANIVCTGNCSGNLTINNCNTRRIGRRPCIVSIAQDAARTSVRFHCSSERTISDFARSHGLSLRTDQAADLICSFYSRRTGAVFNISIKLACKGANWPITDTVSNNNTFINCTTTNANDI